MYCLPRHSTPSHPVMPHRRQNPVAVLLIVYSRFLSLRSEKAPAIRWNSRVGSCSVREAWLLICWYAASQERLRHSVRLQRMGPRGPKRCDTPLLPLHSVPDFGNDDSNRGRANRTRYPTCEDVASSPSSTPSFSLNTPLSTSNPLHNTGK
jgi:hypothetical protein